LDRRLELVPLEGSFNWASLWEKALASWHYPQLPRPFLSQKSAEEFPFSNYRITIGPEILGRGAPYVENLFHHLIVHYIFCPRSLEASARLGLAASKVVKDPSRARAMVNVFCDIVSDSFRLERSPRDERMVFLGWRRLAEQDLSPLDKTVLGFLGRFWKSPLYEFDSTEVELLLQVFSPGIRDKSLWERQCQQMARILEPLARGHLGRGPVRSVELLKGNADAAPLGALASRLEPAQYERILAILGLKGDLKRWYRDQSYSIEIRSAGRRRQSTYPSGFAKWRHTDPLSELDVSYSLSMSPWLVPGLTTYKRETERGFLSPLPGNIPDLLVVLDSSRSMGGHSMQTKTHKATLAAFKACQFALQQGAEIAAINFSDKYLLAPWTRDLGAVEDVLVEHLCGRTSLPGRAILEMAKAKKGCLILCISDTHIQNLYTEWDYLEEVSSIASFVLFCIHQEGTDRRVEEALKLLGKVYYVNSLQDLLFLVVETTEGAYGIGESFISLESCARPGMPG
jgi:hypothetical protein